MRPATAGQVEQFARVVLASALVGGVYGGLVGLAEHGVWLRGALIGVLNGIVISAPIAAVEILAASTRLGRVLVQAPFLAVVAVKGLLYGALITAVIGGEPVVRLLGVREPQSPLAASYVPLSLAFSFGLTLVFIFVLEISRIVGGRTLRDIVLGRYHRPRGEERFFLFVDVAGSTPLAERIGPAAVHRFLDRVFRLASNPIDDHRGEVYQYVGDEIVVTWTVDGGRPGARPIGCFFAVEDALAAAGGEFERDFGAAPRLRGALHAGPVISGEVGGRRRAVVFHGDVMNTTARLEQTARDLDRRFLVSADALERLPALDGYALEDLGPQRLRGREAPVRVYAVEGSRGGR